VNYPSLIGQAFLPMRFPEEVIPKNNDVNNK
jgi:hypothetical protein